MGSRAGKAALYLLMALLIAFTGTLPSSAQQKSNQKGWLQQQFWQAQRNPQAYQQKQQQRLDLQQRNEQRIRDAERAARQARDAQKGTVNQGTRNPPRPTNDNAVNDNRRAETGPSNRISTYARPPSSAKRATPVALPTDAAKLTPAQIKAGFKNQFANGKALVTVGKKTFAINPNGITGKPSSVATNPGKLGAGTTIRLTGLVASGRTQSGGKLPPGNGRIIIANENRKIWYFREPVGTPARAKAVMDFMKYYGVPDNKLEEYLKGHDLDKPIGIRHIKKGDRIIQWGSKNRTGQWFSTMGESWERLGIEPNLQDGTPRNLITYVAKEDIFVLESTAKDFQTKDRVLKGGGKQFFTFETNKLEAIYE